MVVVKATGSAYVNSSQSRIPFSFLHENGVLLAAVESGKLDHVSLSLSQVVLSSLVTSMR